MEDPAFDPLRTVVLEEKPDPAPEPGGDAGRIALIEQDTDHMAVHVETPSPAILLITDSYSRGWRVKALNRGDSRTYKLLPADCALRAVPLAAGTHDLQIEYAPRAFRVGLWVSIGSTVLFALLCLLSVLGAARTRVRRLVTG
jgi:hypothetical protein